MTSDAPASGAARLVARQLGLLVGLAGLGFVVWTLFDDREEIAAAFRSMDGSLVLPTVLAAGVGMSFVAYAWRRCLRILGADRPVLDTFARYFMGELGKYVPGGVWALVGRGELLQRVGVGRRIAYSSIALGLATTYGAALLTAVVTFALGGADTHVDYWWMLPVACALGFAALHPAVLRKVLALAGRVLRRDLDLRVPSWGESAGLILWNIPAWLAIGTATWLIAVSLDPGDPAFVNVLFATSLAWFVGFAALPVPGGIGVREAVFVATATTLGTAGVAAAVAVAARLLFVVIDVAAALAFTLVNRRNGRNDGGERAR